VGLDIIKPSRSHKSQPFIEKQRIFEDFKRLNKSNLSELSLEEQKHSLVGYLVPKTKQFNATECFKDIKLNQI
jgi:hypothetical protein